MTKVEIQKMCSVQNPHVHPTEGVYYTPQEIRKVKNGRTKWFRHCHLCIQMEKK